MKLTTKRAGARPTAVLLSLTAGTFLLAACGSSSGSSATATAAVQAPPSSSAAAPAAGGSVAAAGVTITTKSGPLGTYLTDKAGRTLYLFAADTGTTSACDATCARYWPPLTGAAAAAGGVQASAIGSSARSDGTKQVTYDGHPLYYYVGDKSPGSTAGQGTNLSGGLWWVVGADGKAITTTGGGAAAPSSASSGYKY